MASDPLQSFAPGDSIGSLKATTANAWTEAARQARKSARTGAGVSGYRQRPGALEITVQNDTGADLDVRDVVQVSYPLLSPSVYVDDLQREPALLGIVPTSASGTPAVLIEPIPDGTTGRAVIMGVAHVVVDITDAAHTSAVIKVGETGYMNSAAAGNGTATILWRETGTGQKLCCVLLCCADGDPAIGDNPDWPAPASSWYCDAGVCTEVAYGGTPPGGASGPYGSLAECSAACTTGDPTVSTSCCANLLPELLYLTVSGGGGSYPMTYQDLSLISGAGWGWSTGAIVVPGCGTICPYLKCESGAWYYGNIPQVVDPSCTMTSSNGTLVSCGDAALDVPFRYSWDVSFSELVNCGCIGTTKTFTVTQ